jgi:hypothetical protein
MMVLGYICDSEACLDQVRERIDPLTNFIVSLMSDPSFAVREAAGECVGRFSEHVTGDFLDKHKKVVPALIIVLRDMLQSNAKHQLCI